MTGPETGPDESLRISVIGTGYLGATHAACLAELGFEVLGVDSDAKKVERLSGGAVPFSEPELDELVARHVRSGRLRFTTDLREAARFADVHFVCVGTPQASSGLHADLGAVFAVVSGIAEHAPRNCLIIGKSTVPVGTAHRLSAIAAALVRPGVTADIAWNPEFLREGHGVQDTLNPDRLVFGVSTPEAELTLRRIYARPLGNGVKLHVTDIPTAELAKVAANAFLATKISFVNAMAEVSERTGADVVGLAAGSSMPASDSAAAACPRTSGPSRHVRRRWARPRSRCCSTRSTRSTCGCASGPSISPRSCAAPV